MERLIIQPHVRVMGTHSSAYVLFRKAKMTSSLRPITRTPTLALICIYMPGVAEMETPLITGTPHWRCIHGIACL